MTQPRTTSATVLAPVLAFVFAALTACASASGSVGASAGAPSSPDARPGERVRAAPPPPAGAIDPGAEDPCGAEPFKDLVGRPAEAVDRDALPEPNRVYSVHDMVTMDYRAERLNIVIDAEGVVDRVYCG